jgi:hypothetical protein
MGALALRAIFGAVFRESDIGVRYGAGHDLLRGNCPGHLAKRPLRRPCLVSVQHAPVINSDHTDRIARYRHIPNTRPIFAGFSIK